MEFGVERVLLKTHSQVFRTGTLKSRLESVFLFLVRFRKVLVLKRLAINSPVFISFIIQFGKKIITKTSLNLNLIH